MTFGKQYKDKTFQTIIEATALQMDLQILPEGEMTEIGEKVFVNFLILSKKVVLLPTFIEVETFLIMDREQFLTVLSLCLWPALIVHLMLSAEYLMKCTIRLILNSIKLDVWCLF